MYKFLLILILLLKSIAVFSQSDDFLKKNNLPYDKDKGVNVFYVDLTGFSVVEPNVDKLFLFSIIPSFGHYISKKVELVFEYGFSYLKYGRLSAKRNDIFHQFFFGTQVYPLKKLNFLFLRTGFQYGNYAIEKSTFNSRKAWNLSEQLGVGIEVLTRKNLVVHFHADFQIPNNKNYKTDFVRAAGVGFKF